MHPTSRSVLRFLIPLAFATTLSCGGGGGDAPPTTPTPAAVATVELSVSTLDIAPGASSQLIATARSSSGTTLNDRAFSWAVVSPAVASVSASGLVTGLTDGTTTITVTAEGKSAAATVNVRSPVALVVVTPATAQLTTVGATTQLTAVARAANGTALTGRTFVWGSSSLAIATVNASGLVTAVAPGTATITVQAEGKSATAAITVSPPDPCLTVRAITVGQTVSGALASADCRLTDNSALQYFTFTLATETVLEIEMTSSAVDPYLFVADNNGNTVVEDDDGGTGNNARVLRSFPAGKYLLVANAYDANSFGAYQLSVKLAPVACSTNKAIALPSSTNASLTAANSCRLNDDSYLDRYDLNVTTRSTVRMDMISSIVDSYLYVIDSNGKLVAQDDDAGAGVNAHIEIQLDPGHYFLLANASMGQTGAYRLDVIIPVDPCAVTKTININQTLTGTLSAADCTVGGAGPIPNTQRWLFNVATAGPIQIDMTSSAVDAYLVLQNATTGAVLAENDDVSLNSTNSRIAGNFSVGQYIINTTTFNFNETGNFSLSVTAIVNATPVTISVAPTTVALISGAQQQLTASIGGSANTAVTWTTTSTAIATVDANGLVRAITPGTATVTARSVADPSKSFDVTVTVTQSASATPNLDIGAMYLIQSVQALDGSVKLVANRDAVARVFLRGSRTGIGTTVVRLRVYQGANLLQTLQANVTPNLSVDEGCCSANITIPASLIRTGNSILADADPTNLIAESNEADNMFPLSGTPTALNVVTVPDFNVRLVPIRQSRTGQTGVASATVLNTLKSVWPLQTVNVSNRTMLVMDYTLLSTSFDEWGYMVRDLELTRRMESSNMYYYGLVRVSYTSGVLGLAGGIPALSAVGVDEGSSFGATEAKLTLAHEMGHTMGLRHAPCGGAAGPDPAFPFSDGRAGTYGLDIASGNVIKIPSGTDIMGYCDNQWVSLYNYRNVLDLRAKNPNGTPASLATSASATTVLMVTGLIDAQQAHIEGAFALDATSNKNDPSGRFMVEGFSANGKILFSHRFSPFAVSDGRPDDEAFVVGVPVSASVRDQVMRVAVREVSGVRADARVKNVSFATGNQNIRAVRSTNGAMRLQWSTTSAPMVLIRNPVTGEVLGISRTGDLDLSQFSATNVELLFSDGASSVKRLANTRTGEIRQ
ncbi:MAG: Ig-like domain-containing protein [Gemmatimonadaceae bacterium]